MAPAIDAGHTWLVLRDGQVAGTVTLDWDDPLRADASAAAGHPHRLAVHRWAAGLGPRILAWTAATALAHDRPLLRPGCVASNARLRGCYEAHGFVHHGDVQVRGAPVAQRFRAAHPGQPLRAADRHRASRMTAGPSRRTGRCRAPRADGTGRCRRDADARASCLIILLMRDDGLLGLVSAAL